MLLNSLEVFIFLWIFWLVSIVNDILFINGIKNIIMKMFNIIYFLFIFCCKWFGCWMYDNKNNSVNVLNGFSMVYLLFVVNDNNMMNIKYIILFLLKIIIFFSLFILYRDGKKSMIGVYWKKVNFERVFFMIFLIWIWVFIK